MRGYEEVRGQSIRLVFDRERAEFVYRVEQHPFLAREPAAEVGTGLNDLTTGSVIARLSDTFAPLGDQDAGETVTQIVDTAISPRPLERPTVGIRT